MHTFRGVAHFAIAVTSAAVAVDPVRLPAPTTALTAATRTALAARAECWGPWFDIGDDVSASVCQVGSSTWTWRLRNDGSTSITYLKLGYRDSKGEHTDVLPGSLDPGRSMGGWAAFTASSRPELWTIEVTRR